MYFLMDRWDSEKKWNMFKFCRLIYRLRDQHISILLFYNSFARSIISNDLLINETGAEINITKSGNAQRRIQRAMFFRLKFDWLASCTIRYLAKTQKPD